jgi:hypothetical protein
VTVTCFVSTVQKKSYVVKVLVFSYLKDLSSCVAYYFSVVETAIEINEGRLDSRSSFNPPIPYPVEFNPEGFFEPARSLLKEKIQDAIQA